MKIIFLSYASYWQRFFFFQNVTKSAIFFPTLIISYLSSTCQASHALVSYFALLKHNYKQRCPQSLNLPKEKLFSKWGRPSPPPRSDACMDNRWRVNFEDCSTERKLKKTAQSSGTFRYTSLSGRYFEIIWQSRLNECLGRFQELLLSPPQFKQFGFRVQQCWSFKTAQLLQGSVQLCLFFSLLPSLRGIRSRAPNMQNE